MKILRSVNRRGFRVGAAGWFTVLRPNTWFPATRLPAGFHSPPIRSTIAGSSSDPDHAGPMGNPQEVVSPPALTVTTPDRRPLRMASIVIGAIAITSVLLWWIMHP